MSLLWNTVSRTLMRPVMATVVERASNSVPQNNLWCMALRFKGGVKTNSGVKKRIRLRGSGSIKRMKSGRSHNTGYKTRQRVNRLGSSTGVQGTKIEQRVRKLMGCFGTK